MLVIGAIDLPFATDPAAVINGGDNLGGVIDLNNNCTGTLIDRGAAVIGSRHILTAAHCVISAEDQTINSAGSGSYDVTFNDNSTTATTTILTSDNAAMIQTKLESLANIGNGNVRVQDTGGGDFRVFFINALNGIDFPLMTISNTTGTATANVTGNDDGYDDSATTMNVEFFLPTSSVNNPNGDLKSITIQGSIEVNPNWTGSFLDGSDIAVITLNSIAPFGASDYQLYSSTDEIGKSMIVTGFGRTGTIDGGGGQANPSPGEEYQRLTLDATAGMFDLGLNGGTATVPFNPTEAQLKTAIESLPMITNVIVRSVTRGPHVGTFEIRFTNPAQNIDQMTIDASALTGTAVINTVQNGAGDRVRRFDSNVFEASPTLGAGGLQIDLDKVAGEGILGSGDSGGPALLDTGGGDLAIAGVASFGQDGSSEHDTSNYTRVSQFLNYVNSIIDPTISGAYDLVVDMVDQVVGNDGSNDSIIIRQNGGNVEIAVGPLGSEVVYYRDALSNISKVIVNGSKDVDLFTVQNDLNIPIEITGGSASDSLTNANLNSTWTISGSGEGSINSTDVSFDSIENLIGGSQTDHFVFTAGGSVSSIDGKGGNDEITGPNLVNLWNVTGANAGTLGLGTFTSVENLTGGTNIDFFSFQPGGSLAGKVDGKAGADILNFSALTARDVRLSDIGSIDGFDGMTIGGPITGGFANIDAIAGSTSATTDKLTGIDATALWTIDSKTPTFTYEAKGRTLGFANFEELTGGSKVDQFDVKATSFAMILNGEGDDDFFNFDSGDLDNYQGKVTIHGGADDNGQPDQRDRIYLDDQGGDNGEERFDYRLEPHSVTWLQTNFAPDRTFAGVYFDETMEFVRLDGTDGVNRFSVRPSEFTIFYVDGNEPGMEDCPPGGGDYLQLDLAPLPAVDPNPVTGPKITFTEIVNGRQTKGVWTFDPPHKEVRFESIEKFNLLDKLTVSDDAGFNSLPLIDVISPTTLTSYSDVVTNFSSAPLEAFSIFDYPVFQPGAMPASLERLDVNNDGMVSPKDLQLLLDHLDEQPGQYDPRLDANRDGAVNVIDISSFLSAIVVAAGQNHVVGGVRTTTADLNCDGLDEIIAVSGANLAPRIQVFNGVNGEPMSISQTIGDPSNTYGVYVSAGDFDGDGMVEIATSMERGSQAVTIWKWVDDHFEKVRSFDSGFDPNASGGVRVSTGDLNGDLTDEIIVSTGTGRDPAVSIFSGAGALLGVVQVDAAYGRGGITTTTGDLDGDGYDEILILAGRRGGSLLSYVPGSANIPANSTAILLGALYTGDDALSPLSGVTKDADGDGDDELFIGQLSDGRSSIVRKLEWNDAIDQFFDDGFFETDDDWTGDFLG